MDNQQPNDNTKVVNDHTQAESELTEKGESAKQIGEKKESTQYPLKEDSDQSGIIIRKIRFVELPNGNVDTYAAEVKDESLFDRFGNGLLIKYMLSVVFILFLLLIIVSFINKCRRNQQLLELRNQKKEVQLVKPEIHYNIMITPELVRKLSLASQQSQQSQKQIAEEMEDVKNES